MPQMSPLFWDGIYACLMMLLLFTTSKLYFSNNLSKKDMHEKAMSDMTNFQKKVMWSW